MTESMAPQAVSQSTIKKMMRFFALMYWAEGWAQVTGIVNLPLFFYGADVLHWEAKATTAYIAGLGTAWVIKPLYGLASDLVPLFGYRRKSWLTLLNAATVAALAILTQVTSPFEILTCLTVISYSMAASSALCGGLLVEYGKETGANTKFCSQQTLWVNLANISAALLGTWLVAKFSATNSLHLGAAITLVAPLIVALTTWNLIDEPKVSLSGKQAWAVGGGVVEALKSPMLWFVAAFLMLWAFNPGFGTALRYHMRFVLHFDKDFIGWLFAVFSCGAAVGAIVFRWLSPKVPMNLAMLIVVVLGAFVQYLHVYMQTPVEAVLLHFFNGALTAASGLAVHVVAANKCPKHSEGFVYGSLLSLTNASYFLSEWLGGIIYDDYFHKDIVKLIYLSAGFTLLCLVLLPFINFAKEEGPTWFQQAVSYARRSQ